MNPLAIEGHLKLVMVQWMLIIAVAWIFGRLGRKLGQPLAVGEIFAGLLLGPSFLGLIWPNTWPPLFPNETQQSLQLLGKLGLIFLLFQVGMEFDYGHLRTRSTTVLLVSILGIFVPMLAGVAIGPWLHSHFAKGVNYLGFQFFVCIALSISALPIMGRILLEMNLHRTTLGVLAISAAAIDDVIGWIGLAIVTSLAMADFTWKPVLIQTGGVLLWFLILQKLVGPVLKRYWQKVTRDNGAEAKMPPTFLAVLLVVLFVSCLVTNRLGVFSIFGAFLFGVALHDQPDLVKAWRGQLYNFVQVALVPIFFTNTGLRTEVGSLNSTWAWIGCGLVLMAGALGKLGGCWFAARVTKQPQRDSLSIAALMNARGTMGLVAINVGYELKLLPKDLFTMFVIMALITTAMCGPMLRWCLPKDLLPLISADEEKRGTQALDKTNHSRRTRTNERLPTEKSKI